MTLYKIRSDNRVFFAGKTGSGKTFMAHYLLRQLGRVIVIDPKISPAISKWNLLEQKEGFNLLQKGERARVRVFEPPAIDKDGFPVWDEIFKFAWSLGDVTVYIDEMYSVAKNGQMTYPLRRIYTQGREHGIGIWASTQRPRHVPFEIFTEAEWGVCFMLRSAEDRKRIADGTGYEEINDPIRDQHGFWVFYETWVDPLYYPIFDPGETAFDPENDAGITPRRIPIQKHREMARS